MNIHLLLTDIWFYTTLFLGLGYMAMGGFLLYGLHKIAPMLKSVKLTRKVSVSVDTVPTPAVSTLRQRLQNDKAHSRPQ